MPEVTVAVIQDMLDSHKEARIVQREMATTHALMATTLATISADVGHIKEAVGGVDRRVEGIDSRVIKVERRNNYLAGYAAASIIAGLGFLSVYGKKLIAVLSAGGT